MSTWRVQHNQNGSHDGRYFIDESTHDNSLSHYGVKGMKWGVRNERETKGQHTAKTTQYAAKPTKHRTTVKKTSAKLYNLLDKFKGDISGDDYDFLETLIWSMDHTDGKIEFTSKQIARLENIYANIDLEEKIDSGEITEEMVDDVLDNVGDDYDLPPDQVRLIDAGKIAAKTMIKSTKAKKAIKTGLEKIGDILKAIGKAVVKAVKTVVDVGKSIFSKLFGKKDGSLQHSSELCHYGVKGMKWGVRKDKAKSSIKKTIGEKFNKVRYSKQVQTAVNTKVGKFAKKMVYSQFDVNTFDDLVKEVGKMTKSPKGIAMIAAFVVLPDPLIYAGMGAYASIKASGVLKQKVKQN